MVGTTLGAYRITRVPVTRRPGFGFGTATTLDRPFTNNAGSADRPYDVARDGKQFLGISDSTAEPGQGDSINVVVNWFSELRARVGR